MRKDVIMETHVLIRDGDKYGGQYVATSSFTDKEVISHGSDPIDVFNEAKEKGVKEPVVFYVPEKDIVQIY